MNTFETHQITFLKNKTMKTRSNFFTKKTILFTALLMVFGFGLFATPGKGDKGNKSKKEVTSTLSADELALYENVEAFYQKNYKKVLNETVKDEQIAKVMVYDMAGNLLQVMCC